MHRIDTTTKFANLFGPGKDGFRDGNKATATAATVLNAAWFNGMQEEILSVIEASGQNQSDSVLNQLLLALRSVGVFVTQALGDSSTKAATTAFARKSRGNFSGYYYFSASTPLTLAMLGGFVNFAGGTPGQVYTLPSVHEPDAIGGGYWFCNLSAQPVSLKGFGTENIYSPRGGSNTFTINPQESCWCAVNAGGNWNVGGLSLALGVGQAHGNYLAARALATVYTNTTPQTIMVSVMVTNSIQAHLIAGITSPYTSTTINVLGSGSYSTYNQACYITFAVPPYHTYRVDLNVGTPTLISWTELR